MRIVVAAVLLLWDRSVTCQSDWATKDSHTRFPWPALSASFLPWRGGETRTEDVLSIYPDWFTPLDQDTLQPFLELAQQRHDQAVQKARESYYHFNPSANQHDDQIDDDIIGSLAFDEFDIQSTQKLPDFQEELHSTIFVTKTPLFTTDECQKVIDSAEEHFSGKAWTRMESGQYQVAGFWIRSVPAVHAWFNRMIQRRLFPLLALKFPNFITSPNDLVVDNAYLFKYTPETGRRTDVHTDSGCLSFTIALNQREEEYQGGGTWFEGLTQSASSDQYHNGISNNDVDDNNSVLEMNAGQVTIRPGGVRHCGHAVTKGVRYIIGGFCMRVDKVEPVRQLVGLASELLQQDDQQGWEKAEQILHAALTLNPYFDGVYTHLARLYQKLGQPTKARQVLEHCHAHVNSKSGEVAYSLGLLCLEQGDYDQVRSCMRVCLEADADDVDAMALMAQAISLQSQGAEAAEEELWYRRMVQIPNATPQQLALAYCNLGVLREGRDDEVELYQKSLEYDPSKFATWYSLACALASRGKQETAVAAFQQAVVRAGDDQESKSKALQALYRLAVAQLQAGPPNRFSSQQEMLEELKRIMGGDNYAFLAAERG